MEWTFSKDHFLAGAVMAESQSLSLTLSLSLSLLSRFDGVARQMSERSPPKKQNEGGAMKESHPRGTNATLKLVLVMRLRLYKKCRESSLKDDNDDNGQQRQQQQQQQKKMNEPKTTTVEH